MTEEQWQWQEPGTAWRGVCTYHITLTVPSREPLLGKLVIPENDPSQAQVECTALGNAVVDELKGIVTGICFLFKLAVAEYEKCQSYLNCVRTHKFDINQ